MLITTSRKPSPRTRTFAGSLGKILHFKYVSRGKMSMRDVLIKSKASGYQKTAVVSQIKGNPSRIEIFDPDGSALCTADVTISNPRGSGRTIKKDLCLRWDLDESEYKSRLIKLIGLPEEGRIIRKAKENHISSNLVHIKYGKGGKALVEFYDRDGQITGSNIYIRKCQTGDFDASNGGDAVSD